MSRLQDALPGDPQRAWQRRPNPLLLNPLRFAPESTAGADRTIYVVNLFPNKAPVPRNMQEVTARTQNLQFANKSLEDVKMLRRIDEVASEAQLRPGPANRLDYASGRGFGLRRQRFFARDNRTA